METTYYITEETDVISETKTEHPAFDEHTVIHELKHFLPAQAPLKDFIHHNTLHAFQHLNFEEALRKASEMFGYKVSLSLEEYRAMHQSGRIREDILNKILATQKREEAENWKAKLLHGHYEEAISPRVGQLRSNWKSKYQIDLDSLVHPILFRILGSYLDQGISMWQFPTGSKGFLASIKEMEKNSFTSFFRTEKAKKLLLENHIKVEELLEKVVGDKSLYKTYLFDQQFAHQGWSGMISAVEDQPQTLLDTKKITLHELIVFELLLEIDALEAHFGKNWQPLAEKLKEEQIDIFAEVPKTEIREVLFLWQQAFEWSYYDQVLAGIGLPKQKKAEILEKSFQAMFCIDDRECSFRRYIEQFDPKSETFGTPGFFGVEFFYQPEQGKFYTKLCPAPVTPKFLIKEAGAKGKRKKDVHFNKQTHSFLRGWLISQTLGFWSAFKLFLNIFRPSMSPATASSFKHMDKFSVLTIENKSVEDRENGLQIGFTIEEMTNRVESLLRSIGLIKDFAPLVYVIGHGSSSVNNPHYAAYDCGACCGRPGSVNARVICFMANHPEVRKVLTGRGIEIPAASQFLGGLHDTTRDEIVFFDDNSLSAVNAEKHRQNEITLDKALDSNAKERSRRFESINTGLTPREIHKKVKTRSVSLFEPRPELNHATNALCIVGKRELSKNLFLDRRSFLNSYDYRIDLEGNLLFNIVKPLGPVCGGINLEYFFSRVDNQKLGAGTKLPHNVMGLFGVANGTDGDLRPGLPSQMIEVHDPIRLLIIIEHFPEVVLKTIQKQEATYEWFINEWVHLVAVNPETREFFRFQNGSFTKYKPLQKTVEAVSDLNPLLETNQENFPVYAIS